MLFRIIFKLNWMNLGMIDKEVMILKMKSYFWIMLDFNPISVFGQYLEL